MEIKIANWYDRFCANKRVVKALGIAPSASELAFVAARLSYRASVLRALKFYGKNTEAKTARAEGEKIVQDFLQKIYTTNTVADISDVAQIWERVYQIYKTQGLEDYTYGNAQKWVNMSIKYYIILLKKFNFPCAQLMAIPTFPVDRIMIDYIRKDMGLYFAGNWSDCNDKNAIIEYICNVKARTDMPLFEYELKAWNLQAIPAFADSSPGCN